MKKTAYILANNIKTETAWNGAAEKASLTDAERKRYQKFIVENIANEGNRSAGKAAIKRRTRWISAAACAAVLFLSMTVFGENVYAAIEQISWSLGNALGISDDLADYKEIVHTSVSDSGYTVTLQEAVATEEKVVVNYTIQRDDGQPMEEIPTCFDALYINGKRCDGASGGGEFLNVEQTAAGIAVSYHMFGVDMTGRNEYRLKIRNLFIENEVKGKWDFRFSADGTDLISDTKRISVQKEFVLENGGSVMLEELSLNELEQKITYRTKETTDFIFKAMAEDSTGRQIQFDTQTYRGNEGIGAMVNSEILHDGRIAENAETVRVTLYAVELPKESGRMSQDYIQIGEPFELDLSDNL